MEAMLIICAMAALVWGLVYLRQGSLLLGGTAFVVLGYVFNHHLWSTGVGPISLTLGRVLLVVLVGVLGWRWYGGRVERRPLTGSDWLAALLLGYLTLRYAFTLAPVGVTLNVSPLWRLVASFWMPAALYLVVRNGDLSEKSWKWMLACLSVLGVYLAMTGIAEVTQQWWAVIPRFISNPELGTHFGRARGPALMSASLGVFLTITFWAAWFLWSRVDRSWRLILAAAMLLMCVALYFTYTRSTWLGLAAGLAVIPAFSVPREWRPVLLAGVLLAGIAGAFVVGDKLLTMGDRGEGSASHSVYQRASFFYVSMEMFADHPVWGCGFGRFYDQKLPYLADRSQQIEIESIRQLDHHNTFLSVLTETGLIGLVLFVSLLAAWARAAWQLARDKTAENWVQAQGLFTLATLIAYGVSALFHDLTLSPSEQWIVCLMAGLTIGLQSTARSKAWNAENAQRKAMDVGKSTGWNALTT